MEKLIIELFITGNSARSERAIENMQDLFKDYLKDNYELRIYDVLESPDIAEEAKVIATPTLIKKIPPPVNRIVGDFSDFEKVKQYLNI